MTDWLSVLLGLGGIGGTLASTFVTQRQATKREDRRLASEEKRAALAMAREDVGRAYERRQYVYLEFIKEYRSYLGVVSDELAYTRDARPQQPDDFLASLYEVLIMVNVYGTRQAASLADTAYRKLVDHIFGQDDPEIMASLDPFIDQVRQDLTTPDGANDGGDVSAG